MRSEHIKIVVFTVLLRVYGFHSDEKTARLSITSSNAVKNIVSADPAAYSVRRETSGRERFMYKGRAN